MTLVILQVVGGRTGRLIAHTRDWPLGSAEEPLNQQWDVGSALAKRREWDGHNVQPIIEILEKVAGGHSLAQVLSCRSNEPEID